MAVSYSISLSKGVSGSYAPRKMQLVSSLNYNLYTTVNRATVWGDTTGGTGNVSDGYLIGLGTVVRSYTVYGTIPAGENVPAGAYGDVITVTVTD